jgi:hypothetical protein
VKPIGINLVASSKILSALASEIPLMFKICFLGV